jgi:hypothetical protein
MFCTNFAFKNLCLNKSYCVDDYDQDDEEEEDESSDVEDDHEMLWSNHGYVFSLGDGIIVVHGLYSVTAGEMVYLIVQILLEWH